MGIESAKEKLEKVYSLILAPKYALLILIVIASTIRLLPLRFKYLLGYDPYFHLAYIRYALEKGEWVNFFTYATGPFGFQIRHFHPLGLWMTPAYIYKLLSVFGISLYNAFRVTPVIFGVLTVVFTYLAVLKLYGKKEAFLSAFFLAVLFGHIFRSMAGYYRGDNYMLFWYSVALFGIALALSKNKRSWRYKRLTFYIIPAFASGFSAIFWQAYYPIFAFLLGSAIMLAVGAFLLNKKKFFIDSIVLTMATVVGALLANIIGGHFGYGMVGATEWLGQKLVEELGLHFGLIKDAFLLVYLKYAMPLSSSFIIALAVLSKFFKEKKQRAVVIGISIVVVVLIMLRYYGTINGILLKLFPKSPILETQRTTIHDLWEAYGIAIFLIPSFFLMIPPTEIKIRDFVILGFVLVAFPMVVIWTRFLFIGSLMIALMAGIGIVRLYNAVPLKLSSKKVGAVVLSLLLLLIPTVTAIQGVKNTITIRPFVNKGWERALTELGEDSNINDVILTWWDQGHWVTYFANRAPVAQGGASKFVAQYYLGLRPEKALMRLGVDYVVVSYDTIMKFGAIIDTANASPEEYAMILMPHVSYIGRMILFSDGQYSIMVAPGGDSWDVRVKLGGAIAIPKSVFVEKGGYIKKVPITGKPTIDAYVYINLNYGYAVLMNGKAFETPLAKLMFTDDHPNFTEVYSDGGYIKIFRFNHPNVVVTVENDSAVLRFTNATGTGIGIYGYLDNGTQVFKKWYGVKGKSEFILPSNLNESVVVRYTYTHGKIVLDRGVFRIDDVLKGK